MVVDIFVIPIEVRDRILRSCGFKQLWIFVVSWPRDSKLNLTTISNYQEFQAKNLGYQRLAGRTRAAGQPAVLLLFEDLLKNIDQHRGFQQKVMCYPLVL